MNVRHLRDEHLARRVRADTVIEAAGMTRTRTNMGRRRGDGRAAVAAVDLRH